MSLPIDYEKRVYAGVLGKIIGVYLGRPFEGWTYERIMTELGEINYYVHEQLNKPLIVTDDDITGAFTFLRALPDYGHDPDLTPAQIGQTWLNYLIENRTILWWGGMGTSTEHTAYLRLKKGIKAPASGSIALNGKTVAEQIGAQIFIDGWAMVAPGDPEMAADLARRAASVSHDGEAIYGAQVVAAMEAAAFVERDINKLIDTAVAFIPNKSIIYRLINDIREWHAAEKDWRKTRAQIVTQYGYDKYGGGCHMVPNHALIIHALLHGEDSFQKSLMIVNTCGWDTDCNAGNVGCLLGIKNGLAGIEDGPDWRGPVADRLYLPTADGGRAISNAVTETYHIVNIGRALAGETAVAPKDGARFHFDLPGAVQGFQPDEGSDTQGTTRLENVPGHSQFGDRCLAVHYQGLAPGRVSRIATLTFNPEAGTTQHYQLMASPTLYAGQMVRTAVTADTSNPQPITCYLVIQAYGAGNKLINFYSPEHILAPGDQAYITWTIPDMAGKPIVKIGLELRHRQHASGSVYLDYLTWEGTPELILTAVDRPDHQQTVAMWQEAWVNGIDHNIVGHQGEMFRLIQNEGRGLLIHGAREWADYQVTADFTVNLAQVVGVAARVQGMRRYYALLLCAGKKARLVKMLAEETILGEVEFEWDYGHAYHLTLQTNGSRLLGCINDEILFDITDETDPLLNGGIALVCEEGRAVTKEVRVSK